MSKLLAGYVGFWVGFIVAPCSTHAEELSEISVKNASYCALYSREAIFIDMMHGTEPVTADTDYILARAKVAYGECLSVLPTLLALPADTGSLKSWLADIRDLTILRSGTKPAAEKAAKASTPAGLVDEVEWRRQCRAEYNTWDEETGTVIRRGNPERVKCPCGGEVVCVY
jgi:hypothetical protein